MRRYSKQIKDNIYSLRLEKGLSLGQIQKLTDIPKTTIHKWIKGISLTNEQKLRIKKDSLMLLQEGRIAAQVIQKQKRLEKEKRLADKGKSDIGKISKRDLFITGIALYWAEGFKNKHEHRLGFCNSDPDMIKFYLHWLKEILGIKEKELVARLTLNESYKEKTKEIEKYWSQLTGIPLNQFTLTFYQHTRWKKQYNTDSYYGVIRIHVKESLDYLIRMKGWIEGLKLNVN